MPANVSSKSPVIVRVMEMPAIDLQHCDAIQSWLSIGPPRSRCHYQDARAIQSPQGLVQSGLNSRSARMVKSSGSLRGIHRRGRVCNSGECSSKFPMALWDLLGTVMERFAHGIKLIGSDCQHHQPCVRTSEHWQLVTIDGCCTILQVLNKSQVGLSMQ